MVWISYGLCGLWNGFTFNTVRARRRETKNRAAFAGLSDAKPVNGQRRGAAARLPYGRFTMDYNGCEVLAACNALRLLGRGASLAETAAWFERHGLFLEGLWGTHVLSIPRFFREKGFAPGVHWDGFDAAFGGAGAAVFSFWNSPRLRDGVHTVALAHGADGGPVIYNLDTDDSAANTAYRTIGELIERRGILPILLITLREAEHEGI